MHAQCSIIIQCNEEKIKYVIFLKKFHRKINGTGVEQAILFFLSEQNNYKLISYIMVKIITCIMTISRFGIISVGQNFKHGFRV